jgi:hypothetical protein
VGTTDEQATGEERSIRAGTSGAIVAGSRYGLPDVLRAPAGAGNLWKAFAEAMRRAKSASSTIPTPTAA